MNLSSKNECIDIPWEMVEHPKGSRCQRTLIILLYIDARVLTEASCPEQKFDAISPDLKVVNKLFNSTEEYKAIYIFSPFSGSILLCDEELMTT